MTLKRLLLVILVIALSCSCSKDQNNSNNSDDTQIIDNISIKQDEDNVLRYSVNVTLSKPSPVSILLQEADNASTKREIFCRETEKTQNCRLVLLRPSCRYSLRVKIGDKLSKPYFFTTKALPDGLMKFENLLPDYNYAFEGYIHIADKAKGGLYLINDKCEIVWYQQTDNLSVICSSFDEKSNSFIAIVGFNPSENFTGEYIMQIDLYGNVIRKVIYSSLENPYFHHDIRILDNGNILLINQIRQNFNLTKWGGSSKDTVVGDGFSILNSKLEPVYKWSVFDHISPEDDPYIMGDKGQFQYTPREDWVHANSVEMCKNGDVIVSFNRKRQIWRINIKENRCVYKLGTGGDIKIDNENYFTDRQHSATELEDGRIMVYDNGFNAELSRAIIYKIDETSKTANVDMCLNLPKEDYSANQSSAYLMNEDLILYGSVVPRTIGIIDRYGNVKWRVRSNNNFYRAIYIKTIKTDI